MNDTPDNSPSGRSAASGELLGARVNRLAATLARDGYPAADRSALKRFAPGQSPPLAFYRLWLRHLDSDLPPDSGIAAWALLTWGLAFSGGGAHRPNRPLGRALATARFAEARLERLLDTGDNATRQRLFAGMVRFLAAKREPFDWLDAARLLLTVDPDRREAVNRRIAAHFYRNSEPEHEE